MALIRYSKEVHPDFVDPLGKPVNRVEIDTDDPLAEGLHAVFLMQEGQFVELLRDTPATGVAANLDTGPGGRGYRFTNSTGSFVHANNNLLNLDGEYTVINAISTTTTETDVYYIQSSSVGDTNFSMMGILANKAWFNLDGPAVSSTTSVNDGKLHIIGGTKRGTGATTAIEIFVDGVSEGTASGSRTFGAQNQRYFGFLKRLSSALPYDGFLYWQFEYSRALSASEHAEIARNPFRVLRPVTPQIIHTAAAGGGGGETIEASVNYAAQASVAKSAILARLALASYSAGMTAQASAAKQAQASTAQALSVSAIGAGNATTQGQMASNVSAGSQYAGGVASESAMTAAVQSGYATNSDISIEADLTYATQAGALVTANAAAQSDILAAVQAGVSFAAVLQIEATITPAVTPGYTTNAQAVTGALVEAEMQAGTTVGASISADVEHGATVSFAIQLSTTQTAQAVANASITMTASLAMSVVAQAATQAGINVQQVLGVTFDGTTISGDVVTPDGRIFRVAAENRVFLVPIETNPFTIQ